MYKDYKIIALCIARANDTRHFNFIKELNKKITECGARLFIYQTCSDLFWDTKNEHGEKTVFELIDYNIADAVIVFDEDFYDKSVAEKVCRDAYAHNIPVISIGSRELNCVNFRFDYNSGFEKVVRHVVEYHGITDIHFIAGVRGNKISEDRINVFKEVMKENGAEFDEANLSYGDYWEGPTKEAVEAVIASGRMPKAIVCANDMMAIAASVVLQKNGYRVPEDVIVTGFDGMDEAKWNKPSITTCRCSFSGMAKLLMDICERLFRGEKVDKEYTVPFELLEGVSCGCGHDDYEVNTGDLLCVHTDRLHRYQENERIFNATSAEMISCDKIEDFIVGLGRFHFNDLVIVVNKECLDETVNPIEASGDTAYGDEMVRIFAADSAISNVPISFERKKVFPGVGAALLKGNPIIFSTLSFVGNPIGFAAFYFDVDMDNYTQILQIVTLLNNTISNYRNMRYLKYTADAMEDMYRYDHLTGLYNRNAFYKELPGIMKEAVMMAGASVLVAMIDINGLKTINDTYGHKQGDFAISTVADAVRTVSLINKLSARFGGDEFVICAVTLDAERDENILRSDIMHYINMINYNGDKPYIISASVGVASSPAGEFDFDSVLKKSDEEMYSRKLSGRYRRR